MKYIGLPIACDFVPPHGTNPQHPLNESPTVIRIQACADILNNVKPGSEAPIQFVTSSGFNGDTPLVRKKGDPSIPMCEQMREYIEKKYPYAKVNSRPLGWGAESQVMHGILLSKEVAKTEDVTLVISTNSAHRTKVRIWLWVYLPKGWKTKHANPVHHFPTSCVRREFYTILPTLLLAVKRKIQISWHK